jgi:hypothetical protein
MAQATIVVEVSRNRQIAVHVEQSCDVGATDVPCDGLPAGVDLNKSEVLTSIGIFISVPSTNIAATFPKGDIRKRNYW